MEGVWSEGAVLDRGRTGLVSAVLRCLRANSCLSLLSMRVLARAGLTVLIIRLLSFTASLSVTSVTSDMLCVENAMQVRSMNE